MNTYDEFERAKIIKLFKFGYISAIKIILKAYEGV